MFFFLSWNIFFLPKSLVTTSVVQTTFNRIENTFGRWIVHVHGRRWAQSSKNGALNWTGNSELIQENVSCSRMMLRFALDALKWLTDDNWCLNILVWHENILSIACTRSTTILSTKHFLCVFFVSSLSLLLALNRAVIYLCVNNTPSIINAVSTYKTIARTNEQRCAHLIWKKTEKKTERNTIKTTNNYYENHKYLHMAFFFSVAA